MANLRDVVLNHPLFTSSRLVSLYSDFTPLKEVNPDGFEANLVAWNSLVNDLFQKELLKDSFVLDTEGLLDALVVPVQGKPQALSYVLEQQIKKGDLIPYGQFIHRHDSIYTIKWVQPLLNWTVNKYLWDTSYRLSDKKTPLKSDKLISKKRLEAFTAQLTQKLGARGDGASKLVFTSAQLKAYLRKEKVLLDGYNVRVSDLDFDVLLKYLERDAGKIKRKDNVIKFGSKEVTDEDIGISQLKSTVDIITNKNEELAEKIDSVQIKLKASLKSGNKELSKNLLRSKKIAEHSLNQQLASLNQLESVIFKIDQSSTNIQLVSALEKGTSVLKGLNAQIGSVERVEHIMDELEEEKTKSDEISDELFRTNGDTIDESEIDEEFEAILKEEQTKAKEQGSSTEDLANKLGRLGIAPAEVEESIHKQEEKQPIAN